MVFTRSGNMKRYHSGSSSNMKNVPAYKNITDYIIHRNVIENEEFKVWKDHWIAMFRSIAMLKPLDFKDKKFESPLEKYEGETYKNITISPSLQNGKSMYMNLNDDQYIYKINIDFEVLDRNELGFWKHEKIGYIKPSDEVVQIEVLDEERVLVLTKKELQVYHMRKVGENVDAFLKLLELQKYDNIDKSIFGSLKIGSIPASSFILFDNKTKILLSNGSMVSIDNTQLKTSNKIDLGADKSLYLTAFAHNDLFFSSDGMTIYKKNIVSENIPEAMVLDITTWNESIAEFEEDKLEEITSMAINTKTPALLLTAHINGDINLWNIHNSTVTDKTQKVLRVSHSLIQNRELLVDKTTKKTHPGNYIESQNGRFFGKYEYNIIDNFHSSKRLNLLDENGVEWIYPYINKISWTSGFEFVSLCSRSGFVYHWDIMPFIQHDLAMAKKEDSTIEKWSTEEVQENLLVFKQSNGGKRRDRTPKYIGEPFIKTRLVNTFGYTEEHKKYYNVNNDGSIVIYNPLS